MTERVAILVGTMTGTAEIVAEEVQTVLEEAGCGVEVLPMDKLQPAVLDDRDRLYLICTSTYGQGDVPDNARDFFAALDTGRPDLGDLRYGVIGLGDSTYADTYNFAGKRFDDLLAGLGAVRIGERLEHNASSDVLPEDAAIDWVRGWLETVRAG